MKPSLLELAERLANVERLSLLPRIPVPCPGGYTYLDRDDLAQAVAALRASNKEQEQ
jgi:hypothetical protein